MQLTKLLPFFNILLATSVYLPSSEAQTSSVDTVLDDVIVPLTDLFRSMIYDFYEYTYDHGDDYIDDGGNDMFDGGNKISFSLPGYNETLLYGQTYSSDSGLMSISSRKTHPFIALAHINGESRFNFGVASNTGADGSGKMVFFSGSNSSSKAKISFEAVQVFGTSDPSICELYVVMTNLEDVINVTRHTKAVSTDYMQTNISISGGPYNASLLYMLLSSSNSSKGRMISVEEVVNVISVLGDGIEFNDVITEYPELNTSTYSTLYYNHSTNPTPATTYSPGESNIDAFLDNILVPKTDNIRSIIYDFYEYEYDNGDQYINDGGDDMYDGGNKLSVTIPGYNGSVIYRRTYRSNSGSTLISSRKSYPFIAAAMIEGEYWFSFEVASNTGADGGGNLVYFSGSGSSPRGKISFEVVQVFGTSDPSICELYIVQSDIENPVYITKHTEATSTENVQTTISLSGSPINAIFVYMLLSSSTDRRMITVDEIINVIRVLDDSVEFNDVDVEYLDQNTSTHSPPYYNYTTTSSTPMPFPVHSRLGYAFQGLESINIANVLSDFYSYSYDGGDFEINDGGRDMYDGGNRVYLKTSSMSERIPLRYEEYYRKEENYELFSSKRYPFTTLMFINNSYYQHNFSLQVISNAGADGTGQLIHFENSASHIGISVTYAVTQIYAASDPTICELYYAFSTEKSVSSYFKQVSKSHWTETLDTTVYMTDSPQHVWMGYTLLSRNDGRFISPIEVEHVLNTMVSKILGYSNTIEFPFPYIPLTTPIPYTKPYWTTGYNHTTSTYGPYPKTAYVGSMLTVCGSTRHANYSSYEVCTGSRSPMVVTFNVEIPTMIGYNLTGRAAIMRCVDRYQCDHGCYIARNEVGRDTAISECYSSCCDYSYCNFPYDVYSGPTPRNFTIPAPLLNNLPVEVLPGCVFKELAPRVISCIHNVFNEWPFPAASDCVTSLSNAILCGMNEIRRCQNDDLFTSAIGKIPDFDPNEILHVIERTGILRLLCTGSISDILNGTIEVEAGLNYTMHVPLFPNGPIYAGEPVCDNYILNSVMGWGLEFLAVWKSTNSRTELCSSFKGTFNKILDAVDRRCNFSEISSLISSCDSVLRNQIRALIVQAKEIVPMVFPGYCEGVEPPPVIHTDVEDIPFLPSCTLRQAIQSVWTCESIYFKDTPYSDTDDCKTNINRLLHCVANRLQGCAAGHGFNVFSESHLDFQQVLDMIRRLATTPYHSPGGYGNGYSYYNHGYGNDYGYNHGYGYETDFRSMICSSSSIPSLSNRSLISGAFQAICGRNFNMELSGMMQQFYYGFFGARNSADVCLVFRDMRDWIGAALKTRCDLDLIQYVFTYNLPSGKFLSDAAKVLVNVLPELEISPCPQTKPGNETFNPTKWLKSYVQWRSSSLGKWLQKFKDWMLATGKHFDYEPPGCIDLTRISCRRSEMKTCESDKYGCPYCFCLDHKYKDLTRVVMQPWIEDYKNWEIYIMRSEEAMNAWENENDLD